MVETHDIQSMVELLQDEHADKGGSTRASRLLAAINSKENDRAMYEAICMHLFPEVAYRGWPFFCRLYAFAEGAEFSKKFFTSLATYIKERIHETEQPKDSFLRGGAIMWLCGKYPELFDYAWIVESSPRFAREHASYFHSIRMVYEPEIALQEFESLLKNENDSKQRLVYLNNALPNFLEKFGKEKILLYIGIWEATLSGQHKEDFCALTKYRLTL